MLAYGFAALMTYAVVVSEWRLAGGRIGGNVSDIQQTAGVMTDKGTAAIESRALDIGLKIDERSGKGRRCKTLVVLS